MLRSACQPPLKDAQVLDMYGCGLPVCAAKYACIGELVKDGRNGLLFSDAGELADQLLALFDGFPATVSRQLSSLTDAVEESGGPRWEEAWAQTVQPLISGLLSDQQQRQQQRPETLPGKASAGMTLRDRRKKLKH